MTEFTPELTAKLVDPDLRLADLDAQIELTNDLEDIRQETVIASAAYRDPEILGDACDPLRRSIMRSQPDFLSMASRLVDEFDMSSDNPTNRGLSLLLLGCLAQYAATVKAIDKTTED